MTFYDFPKTFVLKMMKKIGEDETRQDYRLIDKKRHQSWIRKQEKTDVRSFVMNILAPNRV